MKNTKFELRISKLEDAQIEFTWDQVLGANRYEIYWKDRERKEMEYRKMAVINQCFYTLHKASNIPHYIKVKAYDDEVEIGETKTIKTPVKKVFQEQLEALNRGIVAVKTSQGIFLSWRMFRSEVTGATETGLTGTDYMVYKNGKRLILVTDSTNYMDQEGTSQDEYAVAPIQEGTEGCVSHTVTAWVSGKNYLDLPIQVPQGGVTPSQEEYTYHANDMSIGDVDGDGEYEYIVKWEPTNSHDVSIKGYTGNTYLDCYKIDGTLLWRLDMGVNIRSGAHYTQFMVYDFNGDGKAEMAVKTAPGTKMTTYHQDGSIKKEMYITLSATDLKDGICHEDNYVCSAYDYREHLIQVFMKWQEHIEVREKRWPDTLEGCFGMKQQYHYPLVREDAAALVEYFIHSYAPSRSSKNELDKFEGFVLSGPEYLTMFAGDGRELQTIPFRFPREDDGLVWGDYSMERIEPCNRVDRFLSGVAYLDGERPYLIVCRGYYTRTTIVAYDFFSNQFHEIFAVDSGHVPMDNPFHDNPHEREGIDPTYGKLAGQGNHSLSVADVDGDGCQEIIYGAACIDHDGSLLYSSYDYLPNGNYAKLGHGDAMHVANINPNRPGLEIFNVFEGATAAPYGYALRDAEDGTVLFGEYAEEDLGRCMIGDIDPNTPGLQVWVNEVYSCTGEKLDSPVLSTNQSIHWAADLTTQVIDWSDYIHGEHKGVINDIVHGIMLDPEATVANNGTKGNPCLIADLFGDFREEIILRKEDDSALRIYINVDITKHKLFTPLHDIQYRTGIAWQNNCYNQPGYVKYYYGSDMRFEEVLPGLQC